MGAGQDGGPENHQEKDAGNRCWCLLREVTIRRDRSKKQLLTVYKG